MGLAAQLPLLTALQTALLTALLTALQVASRELEAERGFLAEVYRNHLRQPSAYSEGAQRERASNSTQSMRLCRYGFLPLWYSCHHPAPYAHEL